jgi:cytochrome c oxidase cbb3-type subunit III
MRFPLFCTLLVCAFVLRAQSGADLAEGKATFRSNCAFCHGLTGTGGRGPALNTGRFLHGSTDDDLKNVIRNGGPGTTMPAFELLEADDIDKVVVFIRSLSQGAGGSTTAAGDAALGRQVYERNGCFGCHRIGTQGSVFGPELTRVGAGRPLDYLRESIVNPSADVPDEFAGVTVVLRDGKRVRGIRINEDTFSVQLRETSQDFRMFQKSEVKEVIHETQSMLPAYTKLAPADLQNLLAYLSSLREGSTGGGVRKPEEIR